MFCTPLLSINSTNSTNQFTLQNLPSFLITNHERKHQEVYKFTNLQKVYNLEM